MSKIIWRKFANLFGARLTGRSALRVLSICAVFVLFSICGSAQETSSISGTVKDVTGAVIPGARVVLTNESSKATRSVQSNGEGFFYFAAVQPGATYGLRVSYKGFEDWAVTGIVVHSGDSLTVPKIGMKVGAAAESVTVTAEVAGVSMNSGEHSTLITSGQIQRLSTVGRDATELVSMLPGFTYAATDASNGTPNYQTAGFGMSNISSFGASGAAPESGMVNLSSDGANIIDAGDMGGNIASVNMDQVQEVKVQTSNFGADQARGPVVIAAVGKSGGSEYHGSLYAYMRDYAANSNDWISNYYGAARSQAKYFYPGVGIGGPVAIPGTQFNHSKRLVFWAGYEYYGQELPEQLFKAFIPSAAMQGGDLSPASLGAALNVPAATISDPTTGCTGADQTGPGLSNIGSLCYSMVAGTDINGNPLGGTTANPNPGIMLPSAIDPGVAAYMQWYPKANRTPQPQGTDLTDGINYVKNQTKTQNGFQFHSRVDENISDNLKLYVTYNWEKVDSIQHTGPAYYGYPGSNIPMPTAFSSNIPSNLVSLNLTQTVNQSTTNEVALTGVFFTNPGQYDNPKTLSTLPGGGNQAWGAAGYDGGITPQVLYGPGTKITSKVGEHQVPTLGTWDAPIPQYGWGYVPASGQFQHKLAWTAADNLTKVFKTHSIKAGVYVEQTGDNEAQLASNLAGYNFFQVWDGCAINQPLSSFGGNPLPSPSSTPKSAYAANTFGAFLMGCPGYSGQDLTDYNADLRYTSIDGYATDEWKVLPKLTLTFGIRLSHIGPWTDKHGVGAAVWEPSELQKGVLVDGINPADPTTWLGFKWHKEDNSIPVAGYPTRPLFYAPRFSVAYDLYGNGKSVFRGGFGSYHFHDSLNSAAGIGVPLGGLSWNTSTAVNTGCSFAQMYSSTVIPCGYYSRSTVSKQAPPFSVTVADPHDDRQPVTYNYNFTVDQSVPGKMQLELAYVGNQSSNLLTQSGLQNQNAIPLGAYYQADPVTGQVNPITSIPNAGADYRPYPSYTQINVPSHKAWANYNSMQVSLNKQTGSAIFGLNYTWSNALAVRGSYDTGSVSDPIDMNHDYGIAAYNRRHVVNLNYSLQEGSKFHVNRIVGGAVNGWEVSGILSVQSGPDLSVLQNYGTNFNLGGTANYFSGDSATSTGVPINSSTWLGSGDYTIQPTVKCDPSLGLNKSAHQYVNGDCFGIPAQGTEGWWNLPYIAGPVFFKWDMTVTKNFKLSEKQNIQIRFSGFNFLNHPITSFYSQDPTNPLTLKVQDPVTSHYTSLQEALNGIQVETGNGYNFGQTIFKTGQRVVEGGFRYNF